MTMTGGFLVMGGGGGELRQVVGRSANILGLEPWM
jgi:hypothetical protein